MGWSLEEHFAQRCLEIERAITDLPEDGPGAVVLLGDSLTEAHPARMLAGRPVVNQGISGDQAAHPVCGVGRRLELVARARPSAVFLLIGINDLANERKSVGALARDYAALLPRLTAGLPGVRLVVQTLLPVRDRYLWLLPLIHEVNGRLADLCGQFGIEILDTHAAMTDAAGHLREDFSADGVHLTGKAYEVWTRLLEQALASGPANGG